MRPGFAVGCGNAEFAQTFFARQTDTDPALRQSMPSCQRNKGNEARRESGKQLFATASLAVRVTHPKLTGKRGRVPFVATNCMPNSPSIRRIERESECP